MQGFLLVTSTQFGEVARDGSPGKHSPLATALFAALEANRQVYFEQVMNEVATKTYEWLQPLGIVQIPGKVVGGAAPADCLAGKDCVGDARMMALSAEIERLVTDAAGTRNILAKEEADRGKPYTAEERGQRIAQLQATLQSIGQSSDPLRQEGKRLIEGGNVDGGTAKLDEALDADEKAIAEADRIAAELPGRLGQASWPGDDSQGVRERVMNAAAALRYSFGTVSPEYSFCSRFFDADALALDTEKPML